MTIDRIYDYFEQETCVSSREIPTNSNSRICGEKKGGYAVA